MEQRTRALLKLLGSDATDAILEALAGGSAAKTELARNLGLASRDVAATLELLLLAGFVRYRKEKKGDAGGRPLELWELTAAEELESLEAYLQAMRHRLIDRREPG